MRTLTSLVLTLDVLLDSVGISSSMRPKERDFLTNFGKTSEPANHQESSPQPVRDWPDTPLPDLLRPSSPRQSSSQSVKCWLDTPRPGPSIPPSPRHSRAEPDFVLPGYPIYNVPRCRPFLPVINPPEKTLLLDRRDSAKSTVPHARHHYSTETEEPLRARSRSPRLRLSLTTVFGCDLEELSQVRLIPRRNPNRIFVLRRYTFPPDNPEIHLRTMNSVHKPIPPGEQFVLSTSNGEVHAILEKPLSSAFLRGIYKTCVWGQIRVKINIYTGAVDRLSRQEIAETPLGSHDSVTKNFIVKHV